MLEATSLLQVMATLICPVPLQPLFVLKFVDIPPCDWHWLQGVAIAMWACAVTRQRPSQELADRLLARYIPLFRKRLVGVVWARHVLPLLQYM
jgi:hypothetical protein